MNDNFLFSFDHSGSVDAVIPKERKALTLGDLLGKRAARQVLLNAGRNGTVLLSLRDMTLLLFGPSIGCGMSVGLLVTDKDDALRLLENTVVAKLIRCDAYVLNISSDEMISFFMLIADALRVKVECTDNTVGEFYEMHRRADVLDRIFVFCATVLTLSELDNSKKIFIRSVGSSFFSGYDFYFEKPDENAYARFKMRLLGLVRLDCISFMKNDDIRAVRVAMHTDDPALIGLKYSVPINEEDELCLVPDND